MINYIELLKCIIFNNNNNNNDNNNNNKNEILYQNKI
jgi:hypothetical protein